MPGYATVAVSGPLKRTFTYLVPDNLRSLEPGQRVLVPFGRTRKMGFYLGSGTPPAGIDVKPIQRAIDQRSFFSDELFRFCRWISDYYFANPADCLTAALPPAFKRKKGPEYYWSENINSSIPAEIATLAKAGRRLSSSSLAQIRQHSRTILNELVAGGVLIEKWPGENMTEDKRLVGFSAGDENDWQKHFDGRKKSMPRFDGVKSRSQLKADGWSDYSIRTAIQAGTLVAEYSDDPLSLLDFIEARKNLRDINLNDEQTDVLASLVESLGRGFKPHLLHGVTGSGKTIVYCHLCQEILNRGQTALVLTPEIALSSTTLAYFRGFFEDEVTIIHSAMTHRERLQSWHGIKQGRHRIVVGPRSAVFAPLDNLGVIIVDEEHDGSYKQDEPAPRFHGRDCAVMRAKINNIPVVLGSASPSMESYYNARAGRYQLLNLTRRPGGATLPLVRIIDMKTDRLRGDLPYMSYTLKKGVEQHLEADEQVILYLNRRGHSPQLKCADCGLVPKCPNCRVNLTYHRTGSRLTCHYCGHLLENYDTCASCQSRDFLYLGVGTQKVEENIPRLFKDARAVRFDSDTASGRTRAYRILTDFAAKKANLLLGTQMVTKGLDLPHVTLVGVLSADQSLDWPDFRASEKAFARLLQVAGRSGRSENQGEVCIQTYYPEHEVITDAARQDYESFYDRELASRKQLSYPPFSHLVNFVLSAASEEVLLDNSMAFTDRLRTMIDSRKLDARVLGPAPCPMYRLRGRYRRQAFVKTQNVVKFVRALTEWELSQARFGLPSSVRLNVDVDPDDMM